MCRPFPSTSFPLLQRPFNCANLVLTVSFSLGDWLALTSSFATALSNPISGGKHEEIRASADVVALVVDPSGGCSSGSYGRRLRGVCGGFERLSSLDSLSCDNSVSLGLDRPCNSSGRATPTREADIKQKITKPPGRFIITSSCWIASSKHDSAILAV